MGGSAWLSSALDGIWDILRRGSRGTPPRSGTLAADFRQTAPMRTTTSPSAPSGNKSALLELGRSSTRLSWRRASRNLLPKAPRLGRARRGTVSGSFARATWSGFGRDATAGLVAASRCGGRAGLRAEGVTVRVARGARANLGRTDGRADRDHRGRGARRARAAGTDGRTARGLTGTGAGTGAAGWAAGSLSRGCWKAP